MARKAACAARSVWRCWASPTSMTASISCSTPTGGSGLNTGVQEVHNLCWKLALVRQARAGVRLLDSYHDGRQPFGRTITEQSLTNAQSMGRLAKDNKVAGARPEYLNEQGMIFGASYASSAV